MALRGAPSARRAVALGVHTGVAVTHGLRRGQYARVSIILGCRTHEPQQLCDAAPAVCTRTHTIARISRRYGRCSGCPPKLRARSPGRVDPVERDALKALIAGRGSGLPRASVASLTQTPRLPSIHSFSRNTY